MPKTNQTHQTHQYFIFNDKNKNHYIKNFKNIQDAKTWVINHLDLSLIWNIKLM